MGLIILVKILPLKLAV